MDSAVRTAAPVVEPPPCAQHVREHRSVLAVLEKRALVWIARRMPRWVSSDHLTMLGLTSMFLAGLAFTAMRFDASASYLVVAALVLNWFGDSLDGTLARVRNRQRPRYGFYVDHVTDVLGAVFLLTGLAVSSYMNPLIALAVLIGYLAVSAESFLATHTVGRFRISFAGVGPTELRILLAVGALSLLERPWVTLGNLGTFRLFDVGGAAAAAGLTLAFVVSAVRNTLALYRAEPLPVLQQK